jgi:hypothetical protein
MNLLEEMQSFPINAKEARPRRVYVRTRWLLADTLVEETLC